MTYHHRKAKTERFAKIMRIIREPTEERELSLITWSVSMACTVTSYEVELKVPSITHVYWTKVFGFRF